MLKAAQKWVKENKKKDDEKFTPILNMILPNEN
jgi:hypothetical protein